MPWWIWAQAAVDLVFFAYVVALSFGSHDERDRTRALAAEIEDLKRKL